MKENIIELAKLGKIPNDDDMSDEEFNRYDSLIYADEPLTYEEAEAVITLFSDDCCDLNWNLLHVIETVPLALDDAESVQRYRELISKCPNPEFRETLETRLSNSLRDK